MHIIYDGADLYCMGTKVEKTIGREPGIVQGFFQLDALNRMLRIWNPKDPEKLLMNWKFTEPGRVRLHRGKPLPDWMPIPRSQIPREIDEERAYWRKREDKVREGDITMVMAADVRGFLFQDDSRILWDGRTIPSPIRGWRCFAGVWGGALPCSQWTIGFMPRELESRLNWVNKNRLSARPKDGDVVGAKLAPFQLFKSKHDLFVFEIEDGVYSIATRQMMDEAAGAWKDLEDGTGEEGAAGAAPEKPDFGEAS